MEMVINAVMLLHLECANPIDSPSHGGCRANGDRRRAPRPPAPSLPSPSSRGPRAGRAESPRGLGPAIEVGSRSSAPGTPGSPASVSRAEAPLPPLPRSPARAAPPPPLPLPAAVGPKSPVAPRRDRALEQGAAGDAAAGRQKGTCFLERPVLPARDRRV